MNKKKTAEELINKHKLHNKKVWWAEYWYDDVSVEEVLELSEEEHAKWDSYIQEIIENQKNQPITVRDRLSYGVIILICIALVFLFFDCVGGSDSPYDPRSDWFRWG